MSSVLPLGTKFKLGPAITPEQQAFLDEHGYLHFEAVASPDELRAIYADLDDVERRWLEEGRTSVRGIPLFFGKRPDGSRGIQRFAFTSLFAPAVQRFVRDGRFEPIRRLVGEDARIGEDEKDGVVVNRFLNLPGSAHPRLGWHTDGLRDLFYLRMPGPMLNVGLHLDDCSAENGGLRLLPGTHTQGFLSMCFRKPYFVSHRPDAREICVETRAGDLTIHDGRLWHRVAQSTRSGASSLRRSMYVPYLTGPREPKTEASRTPLYHVAASWLRRMKSSAKIATRAALFLAVLATVLISATARAGGYWNFDKGVENYARGGAAIVAPSDPLAIYLNPSALAAHPGFQFTIDFNATSDHRRFTRASDDPGGAGPRSYGAVQNRQPVMPSPGLFASWNAAAIGVPRVTIGAGLYGPPRSDAIYSADGPQRYSIVESHNLEVHDTLGFAVAIPELHLRAGLAGMLVTQTINVRQSFNTFLGDPEAPGYDAGLHIHAVDNNIPSAIAGLSADLSDRISIGASGQLGWAVDAKGHLAAELGSDLAQKATIQGDRVEAKFHMPPIARGGIRYREPSGAWDAELDVVWEGWSANRDVAFIPQGVFLVTTSGLSVKVPTIHVPTRLRDTFSIRTGGSLRASPSTLLRGGIFYERAAIEAQYLSMGTFDLDKLGVSTGARIDVTKHVWLDLAAGAQYWFSENVTNSGVKIPDPVHGGTRWPIGNGR